MDVDEDNGRSMNSNTVNWTKRSKKNKMEDEMFELCYMTVIIITWNRDSSWHCRKKNSIKKRSWMLTKQESCFTILAKCDGKMETWMGLERRDMVLWSLQLSIHLLAIKAW